MRAALRLVAVASALTLAGCAQSGDFGRQRPNVISDHLLPIAGIASTALTGEGTSYFDYTDDERTLRNLGWSLVVPTHAEDWIGRTSAQLQSAEIARRLDLHLSPSMYSLLLSTARYRSSDVRYARIMDDAAKDMAAIVPYAVYARRVRLADEQRLRAADALPDIHPVEYEATIGRVAQNERQIAWVKRALLFRLYSYRYAVDRLMIQTPSRLAGQTIERLNLLEETILTAIEADLPGPVVTYPTQRIDLMDIVTKA